MKKFIFIFNLVCFVLCIIFAILIDKPKLLAITGWIVAILFTCKNYINDLILEECTRIVQSITEKMEEIKKTK